jgi:hypothetical protein
MKSLSASKVDCFFGCARLFYYRYVAPPYTPPENKYFLLGNIAHSTLESFYDKGFHKQENYQENLVKCLKDAYVKHNVLAGLKKNVILRKDVDNIRLMMKNYLNTVICNEDPPEVLYVEKFFNIKIDGVNINGKADRVDNISGGFKIIDYKTNSKAFTKNEIFESVQLPTYKLWLDTVKKNQKVLGEYVYLKLISGKKGRSTFEIMDEHVQHALDKYKQVQQELNNGCKFERNFSYKYCGKSDR